MVVATITVDASDLMGRINTLSALMKPEAFHNAMYGIMQRTGGHVKKILREDIPHEYYFKPGEVAGAVGTPKLSFGAGGVGCTIPIRAPRKKIGGGGFGAFGGKRGWNSLHGGKYHIRANIVKDGRSTLPLEADTYAGFPPFRNIGSRLAGGTYTRTSRSRGPLMRVAGIAVPQAPMNRSEPEVQKDIHDYLAVRIEARLMALMASGR